MYAQFNRFELNISKEDARTGSHSGQCAADIEYLRQKPTIRRQLAKLDPSKLAAELQEYGAWDADELSDHDANLNRILWIACGNIRERIPLLTLTITVPANPRNP